jgi:hypothetical protein
VGADLRANFKRILIGLVAVFLVGEMSIYFYPSFDTDSEPPFFGIDSYVVRVTAIGCAFTFIATAVGGFIARAKFVVPAMIYMTADFAFGVFRGFALTRDLTEGGGIDISFLPWILLSLTIFLVAAAGGSIAGMKLFAVVDSRRFETQ